MVVGHSLGAGAAALLAIMLRSSYPQVRCYAFSPPRGLLRYVLGGAGAGPGAGPRSRLGSESIVLSPAGAAVSPALVGLAEPSAASPAGAALRLFRQRTCR